MNFPNSKNRKEPLTLFYKGKCLIKYYLHTEKGHFELIHYGELFLLLALCVIVIEMVW